MTADRSLPPGEVAARVARARHDLRTPVNALIGYSEMLLEDADAHPDLADALRRLHALGKHLHGLIGEALPAASAGGEAARDLAVVEAAVRGRLLGPATDVAATATALLKRTEGPAPHPFHSDLRRLATAAEHLLALLGDLFGAAPPASEPETVPLPSPTAAGGGAEADAEAMFEGMSGHVLVVDDNRANRDLLARGLHRQKHFFALAPDGRRALDMLATGAFDLVLLDIVMPEMDGFEVLRRLKADPRLRDVPVIMVSALDEIAAVVRCIEMGAEDYLPKPFDPVLLRARVGACLEKKRLRDLELAYLRDVAAVTEAAAAVEAGEFDPEGLAGVAARGDALGRLARVFQSMAREVRAREQRLRQEVQGLRIEIDVARKARQVAEITETAYFETLKDRAEHLRRRREGDNRGRGL
jgi:CheY-like chemotaxis protein